jgi:hypothetical protein
MQAAARAAVVELARGLSTGIVVLAGSSCPPCACAPSLVCAACADCACYGGERVAFGPEPLITCTGVIALVWTLVCGFIGGWYLSRLQPLGAESSPETGKGKKGGGVWLQNGCSGSGSSGGGK